MYFDTWNFEDQVRAYIVKWLWGFLLSWLFERPSSALSILRIIFTPVLLPLMVFVAGVYVLFGVLVYLPFFTLSCIKFGKPITGGGGTGLV